MGSNRELQAVKDLDCRELLQFPVTTFTPGRYMTAVIHLRQVEEM
jgi:hypothetical protein